MFNNCLDIARGDGLDNGSQLSGDGSAQQRGRGRTTEQVCGVVDRGSGAVCGGSDGSIAPADIMF